MPETMTIRELEKVGTFSHTCVALGVTATSRDYQG